MLSLLVRMSAKALASLPGVPGFNAQLQLLAPDVMLAQTGYCSHLRVNQYIEDLSPSSQSESNLSNSQTPQEVSPKATSIRVPPHNPAL